MIDVTALFAEKAPTYVTFDDHSAHHVPLSLPSLSSITSVSHSESAHWGVMRELV